MERKKRGRRSQADPKCPSREEVLCGRCGLTDFYTPKAVAHGYKATMAPTLYMVTGTCRIVLHDILKKKLANVLTEANKALKRFISFRAGEGRVEGSFHLCATCTHLICD